MSVDLIIAEEIICRAPTSGEPDSRPKGGVLPLSLSAVRDASSLQLCIFVVNCLTWHINELKLATSKTGSEWIGGDVSL